MVSNFKCLIFGVKAFRCLKYNRKCEQGVNKYKKNKPWLTVTIKSYIVYWFKFDGIQYYKIKYSNMEEKIL